MVFGGCQSFTWFEQEPQRPQWGHVSREGNKKQEEWRNAPHHHFQITQEQNFIETMLKLPKVYEIRMVQCNSWFCLFPARKVGAHMLALGALEEMKGRMAVRQNNECPCDCSSAQPLARALILERDSNKQQSPWAQSTLGKRIGWVRRAVWQPLRMELRNNHKYACVGNEGGVRVVGSTGLTLGGHMGMIQEDTRWRRYPKASVKDLRPGISIFC